MAKALVIVESPAKAKTINKYLGKQYVVMASLGHVKDLPKKDLAVDVENGFEPRYEVIEGKKKLIGEVKGPRKKGIPSNWRPTRIARAKRSSFPCKKSWKERNPRIRPSSTG